jgi:hypothetical protein
MDDFWDAVSRHLILSAVFFLPADRKKSLERWLRGRVEFRKLQRTDCVLMSWGKSGRTWLRVMLSRFYQVKYELPPSLLLEFENLHRRNPAIPRVFFSHNNYLRDYTKNWTSKKHFEGKKILLLVRDPRDVAVSQFFQWKYRMRPTKKFLNDYPAHGAGVSPFDFAMNPTAGLPRIIDFFNGWASELRRRKDDFHLVRYEDLRAEPERRLRQIVAFLGTAGTDEQIREAVSFASYDNMKKLEERKVFWLSGARVAPGDRKNPDSYKVRRAKVGGYRDYFDDRQIAEIDGLVETRLDPFFGYTDGRTSALAGGSATREREAPMAGQRA